MTFRWENPWLLALALLAALILGWRSQRGGATFGAFSLVRFALRPSRGPSIQKILAVLAILCCVVAAARPQYGRTITERTQAGRDLMLVIDLSLSMKVDDMVDADGNSRDRLAAVMQAADQFIAGRESDRIGLVFFGNRAITSCPLTFDHASVREFLSRTETLQRQLWSQGNRVQGEVGLLGDGTNFGLGIGYALRWLEDENSQGKAIVMITDGKDTTSLPNWEDPVQAAKHALAKQVRVHCIGVGNPRGTMSVPGRFNRITRIPLQQNLLPDQARLEEVARASGGVALMANDDQGLRDVFSRIDELEPSEHTVRQRDDYSDRFLPWLLAALGLAGCAIIFEPRWRGV